MTIADLLTAVYQFHGAHGYFPSRGYVSPRAALEMASLGYVLPRDGHVGHDTFGVADWFIDPTLTDTDIRLEGATNACEKPEEHSPA